MSRAIEFGYNDIIMTNIILVKKKLSTDVPFLHHQ